MSFEDALWYHLTQDSAVNALVQERVYPAASVQPEAALPYVTYQRISRPPVVHQTAESDLDERTYRILAWAGTHTMCDALAEAIKGALDYYAGTMGDPVAYNVRRAYLAIESSDFGPPTDGSERGPHRQVLDFVMWFQTDLA